MRIVRRLPEHPPQRPPPVVVFLVRALSLLFAALVPIYPVPAGDPVAEQRDADARQKLFVRRALSEDHTLSPHAADIWVEVRGTTVMLSGKVPSAPSKQLAVHLAGQVKGVGEVRADDLRVADNGVSDVPSPFVEGVPPKATLAGNKERHTTRVPDRIDVPLGDPVVPDPAEPVKTPLAVILPPIPLPAPADLASSAEALRRKDDRFRRLKIELRQKMLYVSGSVARWDDAAALAESLRLLPGVALVILDNVRVDPTGLR
jgi:hypothetical protein